MSKHNYKDFVFKSEEELFFYYQMEELLDSGIVLKIEYEPETFVLSEGLKLTDKANKKHTVLSKDSYTPDFKVTFDKFKIYQIEGLFQCLFDVNKNPLLCNCGTEYVSYFEIKGTFDRFGTSRETTTKINWLYSSKQIYIQLIKIGNQPKTWWDMTFVPKKVLDLKKKTNWKFKIKTLNNYGRNNI